MNKPFYSIVTNAATKTSRINIYGVIGESWWEDGNTAKRFVRDFTVLENSSDRIDVHINSLGGSVWDGLAIFNAIRASKKDVHTYNDGVAFSMGAMILLAGHTVHAAKGSLMMLHNTSGGVMGNAEKMRKTADMLDKHDTVLSDLIADKSGKTADEVKALWMNMEDNFLTANEASEFKLVDVVEAYEAENVPQDSANMTSTQVAAFFQTSIQNQNSDMKFTKIEALAGVEKPTAEQLEQANADLATAGVTGATIVDDSVITEAADATAENARLTGELATANENLATAETARADAASALVTANKTIADLRAQLAKKPGATHTPAAGSDTPPADGEDDIEAILAAMPHNRKADSL